MGVARCVWPELAGDPNAFAERYPVGVINIGAAARLAQKGDLVIIVAYARMEEAEAKSFQPRVVLVDAANRPQPPALRILET